MKVGLVGPSYQQRSLPFDAQRTINFFPVFDEQGKEVASLYGAPGLELFATAGVGPIRGVFASANGRAFAVSGSELYEISAAGTATSRGTLLQSQGNVLIVENPTQLAICDGVNVYILTYATNAFAQVTDVDLPSSGTITFIDGYFVVNKNNTGQFNISSLNDGTAWAALDFATAESEPDSLLRVINSAGQLYLMGSTTTEIWTNTGASPFPFQRISGAVMAVGIRAPHTAVSVNNTLLWVGRDKLGTGIVYSVSGFSPKRISTEAIELRLQQATDTDNMRAYAYQQDGHVFYVITGGGLDTSLVYDLTTGLWHERAYLGDGGVFEQHLGCCGMYIFGKHLVGDRRNGRIYEMSLDFYDDAGDALVSERVYTHISDEDKQIRYNKLEIGVETGVGLQSGQGSAPVISLYVSKDGARTWSDSYTASIGAVGKYKTKVAFRRLGVAEQMTFKIRISDPVKRAITGSYLS